MFTSSFSIHLQLILQIIVFRKPILQYTEPLLLNTKNVGINVTFKAKGGSGWMQTPDDGNVIYWMQGTEPWQQMNCKNEVLVLNEGFCHSDGQGCIQ